MNPFIGGIAIAIAVMLETSFLPYLSIFGTRPDLVLVLTVFAGFKFGRGTGTILGLAGGLVEDMAMGRVIGLSGLGKMTIGYLVGSMESKFFKDNSFVPAILAFAGTFIYEALYCLVGTSFGLRILPALEPRKLVLLSAVYNGLTCGVGYAWSIRSTRRAIITSMDRRL